MNEQATEEKTEHEPTIKIEDIGPASKRLIIEVSPDHIALKVSENYQSLQDEALLPGFRRGRAPQRLLEKRFGEQVRSEVCNQLVGESYTHAVEEHDLRVVGEPSIKDQEELELPEEGSFTFEVEVEVAPEVQLPDLKGIKIQKPGLEVTDDDVATEIERYREMYGQPRPVDQAEGGDYLTANVVIRAASGDDKGEVLDETQGSQMLVPGESRNFKGVVRGIVIEDLGKRLEGSRLGETIQLTAKGPARHENEDLAERDLEIELNINRIERTEALSVEDLVQSAGMENLEELKGQVRQSLEHRATVNQQQAMAAQVTDLLMKKVQMEVPQKLSGEQAHRILQRRALEMLHRGASQQDIEEHLAELREGSQAAAQQEIKMHFILDAVARQLDVEVSEAEVNSRIVQTAMQQGRRPERVRDEMRRGGQLQQLYVQLRDERAVLRILEEADVTEVTEEAWRKSQGLEPRPAAKKPAGTKKKTAKKAPAKSAEKDKPAEGKSKAPAKKAKTEAEKKPAKKTEAAKTTKKKPAASGKKKTKKKST
ncbi:MAG: trigger factor [Phycisphaerae bacterium]|nr:trigger factor [Phycisphaerae bacterium]